MNYKEYYITDKNGKSNCVIRTFCKIYDKDYDDVYKELMNIKQELHQDNYNDIIVFETYMKRNNTYLIDYGKDLKIKDLKLDNENYVVFCYDKKDFYHMVPIINNTLYDRTDESLELYVISVYKNK